MKNLLIILIFLTSCTSTHRYEEYCCSLLQKEKVADKVQQSLKDANNMSDEEMEDVIFELRRTYTKSYCIPIATEEIIYVFSGNRKSLSIPPDSLYRSGIINY